MDLVGELLAPVVERSSFSAFKGRSERSGVFDLDVVARDQEVLRSDVRSIV